MIIADKAESQERNSNMKATVYQRLVQAQNGNKFTAYSVKLTNSNGLPEFYEAHFPKNSLPDNGGKPLEIEIPKGSVAETIRTYIDRNGEEQGIKGLWISDFTITSGLANPFDDSKYI